MKIAGILALLVGLLFGVIAVTSEKHDVDASAQQIHDGFEAIHDKDNASLDRILRDAEEQKASEDHEWVGCAVFVIAGIALFAGGSNSSESDSDTDSDSGPITGLGLNG